MSNPERLFRDAEGAALERVARLEDENRRLRAEVERLSTRTETVRSRSPVGHPLPGRFFVLAMALPLGVLALLLAVGPRHHTRPHLVVMPYGETFAPRPVLRTASPTSVPPYTVDADGNGKHHARGCDR